MTTLGIQLKCKECHFNESEFEVRIRFNFPEEDKHSVLSGVFCTSCVALFVNQNNATIERINPL